MMNVTVAPNLYYWCKECTKKVYSTYFLSNIVTLFQTENPVVLYAWRVLPLIPEQKSVHTSFKLHFPFFLSKIPPNSNFNKYSYFWFYQFPRPPAESSSLKKIHCWCILWFNFSFNLKHNSYLKYNSEESGQHIFDFFIKIALFL